MENRNRENFLVHVMNTGFERAAASFSKLINQRVTITSAQSTVVRYDGNFSYLSEEQGEVYVLITRIIGEISGKSFLIFSQDESLEIFKAIGLKVQDTKLNEAFLLEIDNIMSASVISELSNALDLEIYGDVPQLVKMHAKELKNFIGAEVNKDDPSNLIFSNTTFQFEERGSVHPQFIWEMSSRIFALIPATKI
ncbi:MAG TPA: hypothetical protein VIU12_00300 [Chryseolinea sp.]